MRRVEKYAMRRDRLHGDMIRGAMKKTPIREYEFDCKKRKRDETARIILYTYLCSIQYT